MDTVRIKYSCNTIIYWNTVELVDDIWYDTEKCVSSDFMCTVVTQEKISTFFLFCDFVIVMSGCKWYVNDELSHWSALCLVK
jgi:hypothetical protein